MTVKCAVVHIVVRHCYYLLLMLLSINIWQNDDSLLLVIVCNHVVCDEYMHSQLLC